MGNHLIERLQKHKAFITNHILIIYIFFLIISPFLLFCILIIFSPLLYYIFNITSFQNWIEFIPIICFFFILVYNAPILTMIIVPIYDSTTYDGYGNEIESDTELHYFLLPILFLMPIIRTILLFLFFKFFYIKKETKYFLRVIFRNVYLSWFNLVKISILMTAIIFVNSLTRSMELLGLVLFIWPCMIYMMYIFHFDYHGLYVYLIDDIIKEEEKIIDQQIELSDLAHL